MPVTKKEKHLLCWGRAPKCEALQLVNVYYSGLLRFPIAPVMLAGQSPARQGKGVVASPRSGLATTPFPWRPASWSREE